jgi:hypothetical protein
MLQGRPKAAGSYDEPTIDPAIFCTAFRRNRFYIFSRREPRDARYYHASLLCCASASNARRSDESGGQRDVFNERPPKVPISCSSFFILHSSDRLPKDALLAAANARKHLGVRAVIHTTMGDMFVFAAVISIH